MNAAASLDYLNRLGMELPPGRKFDLESIRVLLAELGDPHRRFAAVHVAGTNGKGSTAALIEAAVRAAGFHTALYTSPHLERLTERMRIGGAEIVPDLLAAATTAAHAAIERLLACGRLPHPPSFFETVTAVAFAAFAAAGVQLAVVEVGLGGRLDATNVLEPELAVITPIGMDHERFLGNTLAAIAGEKAGIVKPGQTAVVSAPQSSEADEVLRDRAHAAGVPLLEAAVPADARMLPDGRYRFRLVYRGETFEVDVPLRGRHQVMNAAVAALACERLQSFPVSAAALRAGFAQVDWPGRLEFTGGVYLDGAHNPLAARALAAFLDEFAATHPAPVLVYGSMRDKAIDEICELLLPRAQAVVFTAPRQPRALEPAALARACGVWARRFEIAPDYPAALVLARRLARESAPDDPAGAPIFVTGSLYLVGEAREHARAESAGHPETWLPSTAPQPILNSDGRPA